MSINWDTVDRVSFREVVVLFSDAIEMALKELLEKKHLYQRVTVAWPNLEAIGFKGSIAKVHDPGETDYWEELSERIKLHLWMLTSEDLYKEPTDRELFRYPVLVPVRPFTIRIYCQTCEEVNPFNFQAWDDIFAIEGGAYWDQFEKADGQQIFYLKYQCQGCKSKPVIFLVQRDKLKIWLAGRIPMEKVLVPKFIPKSVEKYYSSALVAYNSGQVLPAKFMFRVFLEQFVRTVSNNKTSDRVEDLFMEYKSQLPDDFKQRAPSLEKLYEVLSIHVHAANETPEIILDVRKDIDLHFETKELFERLARR